MFSEHGTFKLSLCNKVLVAECAGAWNGETARAYGEQATQLVKPLLGSPWAQISIVTDWELATPEVEPIMARLVSDATRAGLCREAVVNANGSIKMEQFNKTMKVADELFKRQLFRDYLQAKQWLALEGFSF